jgi:hypothetical protein
VAKTRYPAEKIREVHLQAARSKPLAQGLLQNQLAWRTCPDRSGRADLEETNYETITKTLYSIGAKKPKEKAPLDQR